MLPAHALLPQINLNVQRETVSHRMLCHPNIIRFLKARERNAKPTFAFLRALQHPAARLPRSFAHPCPRRC